MSKRNPAEQGAVLLTMALCAMVLFGACGLAVDLGRMFVARNELQNIADSAAIAAAMQLNGEASGLTRAADEVTAFRRANRWHLGTAQLAPSAVLIDYGQWNAGAGAPGNWATAPGNPANYSFARVTVSADVPVYFMAAVRGSTTALVRSAAIAGQQASTTPQGLFPFTPMAHNAVAPNFGLQVNREYTLKWASSPKLSKGNLCEGDFDQVWIDKSDGRGSENRGYYGSHSASEIRDQVANDAPVQAYAIGDIVELTGGAKSSVKSALEDRILSDPDHYSTTFAAYEGRGRTRRIITCPITNPDDNNRVLGYGRFFLKTADNYEDAQGNDPWCAVYLGPGVPEGSDSKGGSNFGGITKVRLWQ